MPQLPSLGEAVTAARRTLWRFPTVLLAGAAAALATMLQADEVGPEALRLRLLATATLALPLLTALTLFGERVRTAEGEGTPGTTTDPGEHRRLRLALRFFQVAAVLILAAFYLGWPSWSIPVRVGRYWQLSAAFHLLVAVLPLAGRPLGHAFWQFNRELLVRFLLGAATAATVWAGLSLALAAVDQLFGVDVPETGYFRLWAVMAFVLATWVFLAGVPEDPAALEARRDYPPDVRVFAQYTLVPLVSVYLVILTLYLGKVVVTWDWPSGWIGWLVSGVAAAGILALLLTWPAAADPAQRWVATFARQFWIAILPSVAMLWMALYQRVAQYGVTERRYFLMALSLWLAALAVYYALTHSRNIRVIPWSLCTLGVVTLTGPWSAYAVSKASQLGRLEGLLDANGMLAEGRLRPPTRDVSSSDRNEISAVLRYLAETHGTTALARWMDDSTAVRAQLGPPVSENRGVDAAARRITAVMGLAYVTRGGATRFGESFAFTAREAPRPLAGYDWLVPIRSSRRAAPPGSDTGLTAVAAESTNTIRLLNQGQLVLEVRLDSMLRRLLATPGQRRRLVPQSLLIATAENDRARAAAYLTNVAGADSAGTPTVSGMSGDLLVKVKR
jgi:hypothetical protein